MNKALNQANKASFYLPISVLLMILVVRAVYLPIGDFGNYYYASKALINGNFGAWIYDPASFNLHIYESGQRDFFLNYTSVPSFTSIIYAPFALLSVKWAKITWNIINCGLLLLTIYRLQKQYPIPVIFWWLFPLMFFFPLRNTINEGQSYMLLLYLMAEGFIQYQKGNLWMMAITWACCIHLKISPAFVCAFLLFNKNIKGLSYLIIAVIIGIVITLPFVESKIWSMYLLEIMPRLYQGEINNTYALNYQSMQVLLKILLVPDLLHNTQAWTNNPELYHRLLFIFKIVVAMPAIMYTFSKAADTAKFSIWLIFSMLVSGYGNSFSLLLLLLPMVYFYPLLAHKKHLSIAYLVCLMLCLLVPFYWLSEMPILFKFPRLYALIGLYIITLIAANTKINRVAVLAMILICFWPPRNKTYPQNYFFNKEEALLVYDFKVNQSNIVINYFADGRPSVKQMPLGFNANKVVEQTVINPLPQKREKAFLVNDSLRIYLSDVNRGFGFYTLRVDKLKTARPATLTK